MKFSTIIDSLPFTPKSRRKRSTKAQDEWAHAPRCDVSLSQGLDVSALPVLSSSASSPVTPTTPFASGCSNGASPLSLYSPLTPLSSPESRDVKILRSELCPRKASAATLVPPLSYISQRKPSVPALPNHATFDDRNPAKEADAIEEQIARIREAVIGEGILFEGPFGARRITYADYTASGRSLTFIEEYIKRAVLPFYANTHTEASLTGRQTSRYRDDARAIIHRAVGGTEEDVVLFGGSGSTWGINRMVDVLGLRGRLDLKDSARPVVFIGPYEHHSNILPWREANVDVVTIGQASSGMIDQEELAARLVQYTDRPLRIGSFSAASNVTGIISDVDGITMLLHEHGALAFWDYAAAAPYLDINMTPDGDSSSLRSKDAVFISPHKFVGGPGTPGILVAKRRLFKQRAPSMPGGGTVAFVTKHGHQYDTQLEQREEGGTPDIVGCIRAGPVFQLNRLAQT
jgi:selenocysteine lyase/cysteine desulfurase